MKYLLNFSLELSIFIHKKYLQQVYKKSKSTYTIRDFTSNHVTGRVNPMSAIDR